MDAEHMGRRNFLKYSAATAAALSFLGSPVSAADTQKKRKLYKAVKLNMLPRKLPDMDKFKLARRCGFEGIDGNPMANLDAAREQAELAKQAGVPIHGLVYGWWPPFTDQNPKVVKKSIRAMEAALRCAEVMGGTTVLLVPTKVTENFRYADAYRLSQKYIRRLLPVAEQTGVVIAVENVWNKFLLSPVEFARYIDEFESKWVRVYFDIGNVVIHGYPQDWIRTLGKRIIKLDVKDFKREGYRWTNLGDGDVNWPAVRQTLDEIGFEGYMTAELKGGDEAYLTDVAGRMDLLL